MDINIKSFMYMFLKLCPYILVCFFTISSIFSNDIKGIVYLVGLLGSIGLTIGLSKFISEWLPSTANSADSICDILSIGNANLSILPISEIITSFTFFYLLTTIIRNDVVTKNIPTIVFFSILLLAELFVNTNLYSLISSTTNQMYCYEWHISLITILFGGCMGWLWSIIVDSTDSDELNYYNKFTNDEKCEMVNKKTYKCKVYQNGSILPSTITQ
tara:strand:- start:38 stop:685 length:648 start_codon:yes stop_codon:yes gene_type:complete